ncbi:hypothetical protein F0562_017324 [Nyssa sinensis]|uniref:F-box associated domain-containing protein n=1 Tax=Nyssa sinensis TaxID=561372 RepID=A0A5J4ZH69_9ASTE|nr:hypothetical protein F0562_017324 [Nyssa sinensis]
MLVSGALHWVATPKPESDTANLIAAFDIRTEDYSVIRSFEYLSPIAYSKSGEEVLLEKNDEEVLLEHNGERLLCLVPPAVDGRSDGKKQPAQEKRKKKKNSKKRDSMWLLKQLEESREEWAFLEHVRRALDGRKNY